MKEADIKNNNKSEQYEMLLLDMVQLILIISVMGTACATIVDGISALYGCLKTLKKKVSSFVCHSQGFLKLSRLFSLRGLYTARKEFKDSIKVSKGVSNLPKDPRSSSIEL